MKNILLCLILLVSVLILPSRLQPAEKSLNGPENITATSSLVFTASPDQRVIKFVVTPKVKIRTSLDKILAAIEDCESNGNPRAKNPTSSAKGSFQIIDGTWKAFKCTGSVLNGEDNRRCAMKIATQSGLHHWRASEFCWKNKIT